MPRASSIAAEKLQCYLSIVYGAGYSQVNKKMGSDRTSEIFSGPLILNYNRKEGSSRSA